MNKKVEYVLQYWQGIGWFDYIKTQDVTPESLAELQAMKSAYLATTKAKLKIVLRQTVTTITEEVIE